MSWPNTEGCGGCQRRKEKLLEAKESVTTYFKEVDKKALVAVGALVISFVALMKK